MSDVMITPTVSVEERGRVLIVTIERPERRNAVDLSTAEALYDAFHSFDGDARMDVAVLTGAGGHFCAGADLQALAAGERRPLGVDRDFGPMGPTRLKLSKPVIAAVEGYAVAGGLELALWCDLRIAAKSAVLGVFNRRFGVPLVDLGSIRLPRLIGQGRAAEMILTGRPVTAPEALTWGLITQLVEDGDALEAAIALAEILMEFPQSALRGDRLSMLEQWDLGYEQAISNEIRRGLSAFAEGIEGAARFTAGKGRHGAF